MQGYVYAKQSSLYTLSIIELAICVIHTNKNNSCCLIGLAYAAVARKQGSYLNCAEITFN